MANGGIGGVYGRVDMLSAYLLLGYLASLKSTHVPGNTTYK